MKFKLNKICKSPAAITAIGTVLFFLSYINDSMGLISAPSWLGIVGAGIVVVGTLMFLFNKR